MDRIQWLKNNGYCNLDDSINHTKSTKFLLPLIGITEMNIEKINKNLLINVHYLIKDENIQIIIVLNKDFFNENVYEFIKIQNLNENFNDFKEENNDYLLIYNLPKHFKNDFILFTRSKYSKMSEEYKQIIIKIYSNYQDLNDYKPTIYECLYPTDEKRKVLASYLNVDYKIIGEISSKLDTRYESFHTIEELKNLNYL